VYRLVYFTKKLILKSLSEIFRSTFRTGYLGSYGFGFEFVSPIYTITYHSRTRCSPGSTSHSKEEQKSPIITSASAQVNGLLYWGS